jgi:hypothetical protein
MAWAVDVIAEMLRNKEKERIKKLEKEYPHWGWGIHKGLRCKNNNNTGCNTVWRDGKLYEK